MSEIGFIVVKGILGLVTAPCVETIWEVINFSVVPTLGDGLRVIVITVLGVLVATLLSPGLVLIDWVVSIVVLVGIVVFAGRDAFSVVLDMRYGGCRSGMIAVSITLSERSFPGSMWQQDPK